MKYDHKGKKSHFYVMERLHEFLAFRSCDLIILTSVLINNFYPCLVYIHTSLTVPGPPARIGRLLIPCILPELPIPIIPGFIRGFIPPIIPNHKYL